MPIIPLKKPVTVDGVEYTEVDFDPSIDALEAYDAAIAKGETEMAAIKIMMSHDGDIPLELAGKIRMSAITAALKGFESPFAPSPSSPDGAPEPR